MPRIEQTPEWKQVSFPELVTTISGGTSISVDRFVAMLSAAEQKGEDFRLIHQEERFVVPLGLIREYFKDHPKPIPSMSLKEEVAYLRKRVAVLESENRGPGMEIHPAPSMSPRPLASTASAPPRDQDVPSPNARERMSMEELREDLKKEVRNSVPLTKESETVKRRVGRPAAEAKL
jgi:hypothetical protein